MKTFSYPELKTFKVAKRIVKPLVLMLFLLFVYVRMDAQIPVSFNNRTNCTMTIEFYACIGTYNIPPIGPNSSYQIWLDPGDSPQGVKADFPGGSLFEIGSDANGNCNVFTLFMYQNPCYTGSSGLKDYTALPPYPPIQYSFDVW